MDNQYKYPTRYEIEQALGELATRTFLDHFAQIRGVFITKVVQSELAQVMSGFFFEHSDIEEIRKSALRIHSKNTLAGFIVHSDDEDFDLVTHLDELRNSDRIGRDTNLSPLVVEQQDDSRKVFKGTIDYVERKPGRVEFLHEDHRAFDFFVEKIEEGQWQVLIDCNKSADARVLEELVNKTTKKNIRLAILDQDLLTSEQTIRFFDELATRGLSGDWIFNEVKQLIFRRPKDEEEEEVEKSALAGITQAILEGNDLRDNPFVKQSEESGYRFTSMTFEFEHKKRPFVIQIHSEFKGRPKVFEVSISNFKSREGIEEKLEPFQISENEEMKIRSDFWISAKEIYDDLIAENDL